MKDSRYVLIVDDDSDDIELFKEAVKLVAPHVECASALSGTEALGYLNNLKGPLPDIIFLDLNMPGMTGQQFLEIIKDSDKFCEIRVVIYTTSSHEKDKEDTRKLGAESFITKPTTFADTCKALSEIARGYYYMEPTVSN
jgi:CheY-like chemotaxis protein